MWYLCQGVRKLDTKGLLNGCMKGFLEALSHHSVAEGQVIKEEPNHLFQKGPSLLVYL